MAAGKAGWELDNAGFRLFDGTMNDYGAPSGKGITVEMPSATGAGFFRGTITASKIQGHGGGASGSGARMWFDLTAGDPVISPGGSSAGISPYWAITDDAGVIRVEAGILGALGISPSQWGIRVNDASRNPIFDSFGLIAVMSQPGGSLHGSSGQTFNAPAYADITDSRLTVSPVRMGSWLVLAGITGSTSGAGPGGVAATIGLDGVAQTTQATLTQWTQSGIAVNGTFIFAPNLSAGSHTFSIMCSGAAALTLAISSFDIWAFRLGT